MKEQDKNPEKQLNEVERGSLLKKEFRIMIVNSWSWKKNGEDARNVQERPRRIKEQTEMNNTLEGTKSRITEAEEQISDLKTEWWKSLPLNRLFKKRMKKEKNEDSLGDLWDNIKHTNICIIGAPEGE